MKKLFNLVNFFLIFILQFIGDNPPYEDQSGNTTRATEITIANLSQLYEFEASHVLNPTQTQPTQDNNKKKSTIAKNAKKKVS